jgi:hypothetical protein
MISEEIKRFPPLHCLDVTEEEHGLDGNVEKALLLAQKKDQLAA